MALRSMSGSFMMCSRGSCACPGLVLCCRLIVQRVYLRGSAGRRVRHGWGGVCWKGRSVSLAGLRLLTAKAEEVWSRLNPIFSPASATQCCTNNLSGPSVPPRCAIVIVGSLLLCSFLIHLQGAACRQRPRRLPHTTLRTCACITDVCWLSYSLPL